MTPPARGPPVNAGGGTRVVLPPVPPASQKSTSISVTDPNSLLDAFDSYTGRNNNRGGVGSGGGGGSAAASASGVVARRGSSATTGKSNPDPIDFLNEHFTSESLLVTQLPFLRDAVSARMNRLDDTISTALQRQSESAEATQKHVQDAKASVTSLEQRIRQVQQKASQSEKTVREITKDMKRLDCAKKNLQRTITTLKRLHMLIHAVEQLRLACLAKPFPDYKTSSHLVDAIRLLLKNFDAYKQKVEPIRLLSMKVDDLQCELRYSLHRGFRMVGFGIEKTLELESKSKYKSLMIVEEGQDEQQNLIMPPEVMAFGTLLVDSLGADARRDFISCFAQDHLVEYSKIFKPVFKRPVEKPRVSSFKAQPEPPKEDTKPEFALEFIEKRFLWFSNLLKEVGEKYPSVFPPYWNLEYYMTRIFLKRTRSHILSLLSGPTKDPDSNNATILLKALQKTIQFEKEVSAALKREYGTIFKDDANKDEVTPGGTNASAFSKDDGDFNASTVQDPVDSLFGTASGAYDNHMGPYIAVEEQSMDEQLVMALEDRTVDTRGELPVFTTSTKLFVYIKGSITRCTALTKGNAFFLLYRAFQDSLKKYAQVLSSKLPPPLPQMSGVGGLGIPNVNFGGKQDAQAQSYRVPPGEEVTVCHVIGTCEYCADTVEALEDLIRDTVDDEFKDKVDMMGQQEAFHDITAKAIRVLVSGLENRMEEALRMMTSINWAIYDEVGEESDYVRYMHKAIHPYVTSSRGLIPTSYFRSFCDKFAMGFTNTYYKAILQLKRISEPGSQQLLLDVYSLKTLFLKLPVLEAPSSSAASPTSRKAVPAGSTIAPAMYTKMVQKQFKSIELLLKMTGTPINLLIDVFKDQWVGGTALDLQTVMALKGLKRMEQAAMLEKFGLDPATARRGAAVNVTSTSIMTERFQDQAAKVNSDLSNMRQKVDAFRQSFR